jgi:hypothetical protein
MMIASRRTSWTRNINAGTTTSERASCRCKSTGRGRTMAGDRWNRERGNRLPPFEIARWFRELQHYGFIVMTRPGWLGVEGRGRAPRWRLTELGYQRKLPKRNFLRWNGVKFQLPKSKPPARKPARGVQENNHASVLEKRPSVSKSVLEDPHKHGTGGAQENAHRTRLPSQRRYLWS